MKGYCLLVLAIVVLIMFQKEPLFTMLFLGGGIVIYMLYKSRRSGRSGFFGGILGGRASAQERNIDDLISLIMIQQLLSDNSQSEKKVHGKKQEEQRAYLEKISKEIGEILES